MTTKLGIKYKLNLLPEQKLFIRVNSGNQRFLYNTLWGLIKDKNLFEKISYEKNIQRKDAETNLITKSRELVRDYPFKEKYLRELTFQLLESEEYKFLNISNSSSLQATISYLSKAIADGLSKKSIKALPEFKKKNRSRESFSLMNGERGIEYLPKEKCLYIPQMKKFMKDYFIESKKKYTKAEINNLCKFKIKANKKSQATAFGEITKLTLSKNTSGEYFASATRDIEIPESILTREPENIHMISFDMGFKDKLTFEDLDPVKRIKQMAKNQKELTFYKRKQSKIYEDLKRKFRNKNETTKKDKKAFERLMRSENPEKQVYKERHRFFGKEFISEKEFAKLKAKKVDMNNYVKVIEKDYQISKENRIEISNNKSIKKYKKRCAKLEKQTANRRNDENHKLSRKLIDTYDIIFLEDLNFAGMKKIFGRIILDLALSDFVNKLKYKAENQGKILVFVGRFFPSSKNCSYCGYKNSELKLSEREWKCPNCGTVLHRDRNAARNIRKEGIEILQKDIAAGEMTAEKLMWIEFLGRLMTGNDEEARREIARQEPSEGQY